MPTILIATPVKNSEPELADYFTSLLALSYPKTLISLAFLESDSTDGTVAVLKQHIDANRHVFKTIVFESRPTGYPEPPNRHSRAVQLPRRQALAKARNDLLSLVNLSDFEYILWLDVDASGYPHSLVEDLLSVRQPIVAPHIVWEFGGLTYDRNSWLELRPDVAWSTDEPTVVFEGYPESTPGRRLYMDDFRALMSDKFEMVPLHGVGTAVLLVETKVHAQGIYFPVEPFRNRIESEGFGLMANSAGFQAVGLPKYEVKHSNSKDAHWLYTIAKCVIAELWIPVIVSTVLLIAYSLLRRRLILTLRGSSIKSYQTHKTL